MFDYRNINVFPQSPQEVLHNILYMHYITFLKSDRVKILKHIWLQGFWTRRYDILFLVPSVCSTLLTYISFF